MQFPEKIKEFLIKFKSPLIKTSAVVAGFLIDRKSVV
jgi:hypothetical protein